MLNLLMTSLSPAFFYHAVPSSIKHAIKRETPKGVEVCHVMSASPCGAKALYNVMPGYKYHALRHFLTLPCSTLYSDTGSKGVCFLEELWKAIGYRAKSVISLVFTF